MNSNNNMVSEVNKIIANQLFRRDNVCLPGLGSLYIVIKPAMQTSRREIISPQSVVEFSTEERGLSLIETIQSLANISPASAKDIYMRWLMRVKTDHGILIQDVGELAAKSFVMDVNFAKILNPQSSTIIIKRKGAHRFILTFAILSILASSFFIARFACDFYGNKDVISKTTVKPSHNSNQTQTQTVGDAPKDSVNLQASTPVVTAKVVEAQSSSADNTIFKAMRLTSKDYYLILGVFSSEENAVCAVKKSSFESSGGIYFFGSKFMVSAYSSSEKSKVDEFNSRNSNDSDQFWIYQAK